MNDDKLKDILKDIGTEDIPADVREIAQETSNKFSRSLRQSSQPAKPPLLELIMRSRTIKLAAAAVIIIAVLLGLPFLPKTTTRPTLGGVGERLRQVEAFMYKMNMKVTGSVMQNMPAVNQDVESTIIISNEFGMKMVMEMTDPNTGRKTTQQMYVLPDDKVMVMIMPEQKRFTRMEFTKDLLARMKKQNNDPREMIKQMLGAKYTELGKSEIDGVEVDGFETTDPGIYGGTTGDVKVTLWVDSVTWLPVLMEMDMTMNEQMRIKGTIHDYQWDVPVEKAQFQPVIPEDFEAFPKEGMKMPEITEEAAIEGLKLFVELTGRYPKQANMMDLMQELSTVMAEQAKKSKPEDMTETERVTKMMDTMRPMQSLGLLYMALVQDQKDPAYYGEKVGPEDAGAVLMRWKTAENTFRVIFADLSAADVTAEELKEFEKLQP